MSSPPDRGLCPLLLGRVNDLIGNPNGPNLWNNSHKTPGCAPANLQKVGGAGLFYCFATN